MKAAVSMWSLVSYARDGRTNVADFVRYAAAIGAQGVELLDYFWRNGEAEMVQVEAALAEQGLGLSAYAIGNDFVQPDAAARRQEVVSMRAGVDMAVRFKTNLLRVFSGGEKGGVSVEQGHAWIVEGLREGAAYAAERGVTLALENHGLFAGRADQVRGIIEAVGSPALRANIDTGNFLLVNQNPVAAATDLADLAAYVHLKDFRALAPGEQVAESYTALDGSRYVGTVIGEGDVDLRAVLTTLRAAGYDGWLSIEYEGVGDAKQELEQSLRVTQRLITELAS